MDKRKALAVGAKLSFPGMDCAVEHLVGRGSNAFVYKGRYPDYLHKGQYHYVLIKELFPYHPGDGIYRDAEGNIASTPDGAEVFDIHRLSFECGNQFHLHLLERYPDRVGANLNTFSLNNTLYTVLGFDGGRTLDEEYKRGAIPLRECASRAIDALDALDAFHESGYLHLDISPDNIVIVGEGARVRLSLIDYNCVHSLAELRGGQTVYCSAKEGYTAPEVRKGNVPQIDKASDLFSVTAVFYYLLTGAPPSAWQLIQKKPPDGHESPLLEGMPDTVRDMARQILQRGLATQPGKRYPDVATMREDLIELIDRIDGLGVTHWALWEAGQKNASRIIRSNPSFGYILEDAALYPLRARWPDGRMTSMDECIARCTEGGGTSFVVRASGGMGKTTSLLRAALARGQRYSPLLPAVLYVSLYGSRGVQIQDRILEDLRFKPDVSTMDDARHALHSLMEKPLLTRSGPKPSVLILLDGLNEAAEDTDALYQEIKKLSQMDDVRMVISTRSDTSALPFPVVELERLEPSDVADTLKKNGLLLPGSDAMQELLRTPLMLSIFVKAALVGGKQLNFQTGDELIEEYLAVLCRKEVGELPENAPQKWATQVAVRFVLPAISRELSAQNRALTDAELLKVVEKCWKVFASRRMASVFPEWIGHSADILGDTGHAEEWYGMLVHDLLWQRMGLLVRDMQGRYRGVHQIVENYLVKLDAVNRKRLRKKRTNHTALLTIMVLMVLSMSWMVYDNYIRPQPYNARYTDDAISCAVTSFAQLGAKHRQMLNVTQSVATEDYQVSSMLCRRELLGVQALQQNELLSITAWGYQVLEQALASGDVLPYCNQALNADLYKELLQWNTDRTDEYLLYLDVLDFMVADQTIENSQREEFVRCLGNVLAADANVTDMLYHLVCSPYLSALERADKELYVSYTNLTKYYIGYGSNTIYSYEQLLGLKRQQQDAQGALVALGIMTKYERRGN